MELKPEYVQDFLQSNAPEKVTPELKTAIIRTIEDENWNERAKPAVLLCFEYGVFQFKILKILKCNKCKPCKITKKLSLTEKMRKTRYIFCKIY